MAKTIFLSILVAISVVAANSYGVEKVDPNHGQDGGYGYLIKSDHHCAVWWAEGAYKVMRDAPLPVKTGVNIKISAARNEYESFIVVINSKIRLENFRIIPGELTGEAENKIGVENISVKKVEYVRVKKPTDAYGFAGWWPDPLPCYEKPETIFPSENQPFWITVKVPLNTPAGHYSGKVLLSSGDWNLSIPLTVEVWNFTLPQKPSMRSGFGLSMSSVKEYENIKDPADERAVFDLYMETFRDYKLSPYNPFEYAPIVEQVKGVVWQGGFFDSKEKLEGTYSYKLVDNSPSVNTEGSTTELIPVTFSGNYQLCWFSKSAEEKQSYVVGLECYNAEKELIPFENQFEIFTGGKQWKADTLNTGKFNDEVRFVKIRLFPSNRTKTGEEKGTVWFDNISLNNIESRQNEFAAGNFEVNLNNIDISLDFTSFNRAGKRYFDEFGFTGYRLGLKGLGTGTFYSREKGSFAGFEQGTEEYNKLMERYLGQMQANLEKNGWLGKEYIYWFDEPADKDYPFVKETNALIKKYAPKMTTFLTEHVSGQDISDVTDISCTIWHKLDHGKIKKMNEKGLEHWSYLCCWPKSPWISEFIDHDAINLRMWLWASFQYRLKGILMWETTYWNSENGSPEGYLQNPWDEAMSYVSGYGWPLGKQTIWGNGDGRLLYPQNRDPNNNSKPHLGKPVTSVRLEILRDGIEDYEYFSLLEKAVEKASKKKTVSVKEAADLLSIPKNIYTDEKTYSKNPLELLEYRKKIAQQILLLK